MFDTTQIADAMADPRMMLGMGLMNGGRMNPMMQLMMNYNMLKPQAGAAPAPAPQPMEAGLKPPMAMPAPQAAGMGGGMGMRAGGGTGLRMKPGLMRNGLFGG